MNHKWTRRWTTRAFAVLLLLSLILPLNAAAYVPAPPLAKVDAKVLAQIGKTNQATFWVIFRDKANLTAAYGMKDWAARGKFVVDELQATASRSQAAVKGQLQTQGVTQRSFWIVNAIQVTAGQSVVDSLAARPEVEQIVPATVYQIPTPLPGTIQDRVTAVEWGIDRINANDVWSTFGVRGEGIVVANIDTGVDYDHPALVGKYRGNMGGGTFDHNYNWFDPSNVCGNPSIVPCDNNNHGTHTMGTMVGDDGGSNQIGVAPGARWIAAKGCETNSCSDAALLASGQWILAPTDLAGANPRPDLRPNIVNNSWGGGGGDTFYQATVQAWRAAGIFPVFSNGNSGPACGTAGSPGDYAESYAVGAFDINNAIAGFSSRGAGPGGRIKPNISAPGVDIRSSVNGGGYAAFQGTSMAAPHLAGTIALIWSAAPALIGDISQTSALLNATAIDTSDLTCGGTAANNNVWGEGRLDAFAAVDQSPRGPTGTLAGAVTDSATSQPIAGATVAVTGPSNRTTTTAANGSYSFTLPAGSYSVTASNFGYQSQTANGVVVTDGGTTTQNFALVPAAVYTVSGYVRNNFNQPVANATVTILNTPIAPVTSDAAGFYSFAAVPAGTYNVQATAGRCNTPQTQPLVVDGAETLNFTLPQISDSFGYYCQVETFSFINANTVIPLTGDDAAAQVSLPFSFTFYGQTYNSAFVATNGHLNFLASSTAFSNAAIPSTAVPNGAVYPFWDDLFVDASASVRSELLGTAPNRRFVIEWRNVRFFNDANKRLRFEVVLHENGQILTQYTDIANDNHEQGESATVGIENRTGTVALQYANNEAVITNNLAVRYVPPPTYRQGVDAGSNTAYMDLAGDVWAADRQYTAGSWGYTNNKSGTVSTTQPIAGTGDDPLYQKLRENPTEYRFDGLPSGVYEVELLFAENSNRAPGTRVFDVLGEGAVLLAAHDITGEVGNRTADRHTVFVTVTDGQLNLRFVKRQGAQPIINALRVTYRPGP